MHISGLVSLMPTLGHKHQSDAEIESISTPALQLYSVKILSNAHDAYGDSIMNQD